MNTLLVPCYVQSSHSEEYIRAPFSLVMQSLIRVREDEVQPKFKLLHMATSYVVW